MMVVPANACAMPAPGMPTGRSTFVKNSTWVTAGRPLAIV